MAEVVSVQIGRIAPLGPGAVKSGFVKSGVAGAIDVGLDGLAGDEQADRTVHGGVDKAVYAYPLSSYALWRASHPAHTGLWQPGGVGENLTLDGLDEEAVCIGDIMRVGGAVLQVSQPRQPCFKFALRFGDKLLPKAMIANGRSGWYYRVVTPGRLAAGDAVSLIERPNPDWPVSRMNRCIHGRSDAGERATLAGLQGLAETWRIRLGEV
jgi:MOSC domain-containing protein YiiM